MQAQPEKSMSAYTQELNEIWLGDCLDGVEGRKKSRITARL